MSTETNLIISPVGEIQFMAVANTVLNEKTEKEEYVVRMAFDSKKDSAFLTKISDINPDILVTSTTYRGKSQEIKALLQSGKTLIRAATLRTPLLSDANGNEIEEAPYFFKDSKGTAKIMIEPFEGKKGGGIKLAAIIIHDLEIGNATTTCSQEENLARIRAALAEEVGK